MLKNLDKLIFFLSAALILLGLSFAAGLYSGVRQNFAFEAANSLRNALLLVVGEWQNITGDGAPIHFLQPARGPGDGVTVNETPADGNLVFLAGFFDGNNELRLVRRDGTPVARWPVRFSEHFPDTSHLIEPPATDRNVDIHGALVNPDGSVVFNYEYSGTVKLSRCGETVWTLAHPTHHSLEPSEDGGYWIPGRHFLGPEDSGAFPPFTRRAETPYFEEDLILKVSDEGEILERKSVPGILYGNDLEPVMTATGYNFKPHRKWETELLHVNKIGELYTEIAEAFPDFEAGDLVLSLRQYNLILVVEPGTWKVKWHRTGPWRRQHDPEFNGDGTITVFNNNIYRLDLGPGDRAKLETPRVSNIVKVNPSTGETEVVYGQRAGEEFLTVIRGKHDPLPDGGFLITEFEGGRVFEVDAERKLVWEYINRYDDDEVLEVTGARMYPSAYFTVEDWSCP